MIVLERIWQEVYAKQFFIENVRYVHFIVHSCHFCFLVCCFFAFLFYANRIRDYGARDGCTFASQTWFWIIPLEPNVTVSPGWMKSEQPWERMRRLKLRSARDVKQPSSLCSFLNNTCFIVLRIIFPATRMCKIKFD